MPHIRAWLSRLFGLFRKNHRDAEMAEEMQAHIDLLPSEISLPECCLTMRATSRCVNLAASSKLKKSRVNSGFGDGRTNFFRIYASARACCCAVRGFRFSQFFA